MNNESGVDNVTQSKKLDERISKLQEDLSNNKVTATNKHNSLMENKREMENAFEERIKNLTE